MTVFRLGPQSKPGELLAALGDRLATYQDRDNLYIPRKRRLVPHATARRDYVCECGSALVTRYTEQGWRTICAANPSHDQGQFLTQASYHVLRAKAQALGGG